jgi:hypothetical protein
MVTDQEVLEFFRNELSLMVTWKFKPIPLQIDDVLQDYSSTDELPDAIEKYGEVFNIDLTNFNMELYYPYETIPLFKRWFCTDKYEMQETRLPLTVRMFAESAKAGKWLYD